MYGCVISTWLTFSTAAVSKCQLHVCLWMFLCCVKADTMYLCMYLWSEVWWNLTISHCIKQSTLWNSHERELIITLYWVHFALFDFAECVVGNMIRRGRYETFQGFATCVKCVCQYAWHPLRISKQLWWFCLYTCSVADHQGRTRGVSIRGCWV